MVETDYVPGLEPMNKFTGIPRIHSWTLVVQTDARRRRDNLK